MIKAMSGNFIVVSILINETLYQGKVATFFSLSGDEKIFILECMCKVSVPLRQLTLNLIAIIDSV